MLVLVLVLLDFNWGLVCSRRLGRRLGRAARCRPSHPAFFDHAQERARAAAGPTWRQSVLGSVSAARPDQQRAPLRCEHRLGSTETEAAEEYKLLQLLLGDGLLARLVLWCYRRRHGVPAEAVRGKPGGSLPAMGA